MFKFVVVLAILATVFGFAPSRFAARTQVSMAAEKPSASKIFGAALLASSLMVNPVFAKEGTGAKLSFFGDGAASSPFTVNEDREDPIYSPYSPYGNGEKAAYNERKGGKEELSFWNGVFAESIRRVDKVPAFAEKKLWSDIRSTLTSFAYNTRSSMLRLAESSSDPAGATAAAKAYFQDLNDIAEFATKKNGDIVLASYSKSQADLAAFKAFLK